ncbi:MAG: lysophospholipid acyltransferase family protein [Candidatus Omnitrophica bacterium]|nr:lysophospholipid acyltransferase family protein [Candidatus Omnitrophota bacterium]
MTFNDRIKKIKRALARHGLYGSSFVLTRLPYGLVRFLTHALISIGFLCIVRQRRIAEESLTIAFGREKNPQEIKKIFKNCFSNLGKGMIELIYFMAHPKMIKEKVHFEGKDHFDQALSQGKGVIIVSAHFGNFPLMLLRLAQEGYRANAIIRPVRDAKIEKYFQNQRTQLGLHTIYSQPRQACVTESLKVLRNNEFLFIPLDQNFGNGSGVFVDFFGEKAATATGPVVFALRTGSPIVPMFIVREKDDTHKIIVEPALTLEKQGDEKQTIEHNVARITHIIERYIRLYPQEWGWMHRRWKSRPVEKGK